MDTDAGTGSDDAAGTETCPTCEGRGYWVGSWSEQKTCDRCKGSGRIPVNPHPGDDFVGGA